MLAATLTIAALLSFLSSSAGGRIWGLAVTSLSGVAMAFFVMPPRFSIEIASPLNLAVLGSYCAFGILMAVRLPQPKLVLVASNVPARRERPARVDLAAVLHDVLRDSELEPGTGSVILPCTKEGAAILLRDILTTSGDTRSISCFPTRRPGFEGATIVVRRTSPSDGEVVTIGKRADRCEMVESALWPPNSSVTWFDNGHERIFQLAFAV